MRTGRGFWILLAVGLAACSPAAPPGEAAPGSTPATAGSAAEAPATDRHWGIGIHGGAGTFTALDLPAGGTAEVRADMERALMAGHAILARGGSSLDAVQAAIVILEDSPNFNAGKGAVFTRDGKNELDAAIMDGRTLAAGAVAGLHHVKNRSCWRAG
jgi:beta-aspartyl-peptidase (threonine type)